MKPRLLLVALVALVCTASAAVVASAGTSHPDDRHHRGSYEVWLVDQEDKSITTGSGTLYVFDGRDLARDATTAIPETVNLAGAVRAMCREKTGTDPVRPHMMVFNGGDDDGQGGNTHAALAFLASGHVAFLDAQTREPVGCIDVGEQAHAAWPTPDQRYLIVANQGGKKLQRIRTDYRNERFTLENLATLDLKNCITPSNQKCEDPTLRPDNAPICPRTTSDGRFTFVTLRGGGMFVVDHNAPRMRIVAEYDRAHVDDNGCGEMEARGRMYVNSGAGTIPVPVTTPPTPPVPGDEPYGHDVYSFELDEFSHKRSTVANTPAPTLVYTRDGDGEPVDAHAVSLTRHGRYLWWGDRIQNDVVVVDPRRNREVNRFELGGDLSDDPAPDLFDLSPRGDYMFASLRGPNPASGHEAFGSTPGVGVIDVRRGGRSGRLVGVAPVSYTHLTLPTTPYV